MNTALECLSPAKLNLFLHICGKRDDGYHELQTLFQLIDLCDSLAFNINESGNIHVTGMPDVPDADNLIVKAAKKLQAMTHKNHLGVDIHVEKRIPQGGGLGGGSSNAATTLLALNYLWSCQLDQDALLEIGKTLGADVPIFILGTNAFAEGIGELLTPVEIPPYAYLLAIPPCHVSTQKLFSHPRLTRDTKKKRIAAVLEEDGSFKNDFEPLTRQLYPEIDAIFTWLSQYGKPRMTGTGACIYLTFDSTSQAQKVALELADLALQAGCKIAVVNGLNKTPVFSALDN
ncbi:MAG: 4-(cytidine 5'-diphospho)-2-C-methyl-D-erythritol kinase [Cellvibrionales bacterium]|nr:4-(cytidine 5'-diphospho)-2-C-methyl-D-erythritol kinase [Cellvibrionales bacterium]